MYKKEKELISKEKMCLLNLNEVIGGQVQFARCLNILQFLNGIFEKLHL